MIRKIKIKDVATYGLEGIEISLKNVNFIYGGNGTGKTTISEFLRNCQRYPSCSIEWKQNGSEIDLFVYNRHFVQENFNVHNEIKGIFTLGKDSSDILTQIEEKNKEIKKHDERIESLDGNIEEKDELLMKLKKEFMERCWNLKTKYNSDFQEAFTGFRGDKQKFMDKCLFEAENNENTLHTYNDLKERVQTVFKGPQEKINILPSVEYDFSLETKQIFQTKIIGKKDIDIAKLISTLDISDWVQQGHQHMENTDGVCPFCQQELPKNFEKKLDEYFDQEYTERINALHSSIEKYKNDTNNFIEKYRFLWSEDIQYINKEKIANLFELIRSAYKENIQLLNTKRKEPSRSIELVSIKSYLDHINAEVEQANGQTSELNMVIDNIKEEKVRAIKDVWRYIAEENRSNYKSYANDADRENRVIDGMKRRGEDLKTIKNTLKQKVIQLQNELTSVLPSINEINSLLKSFGFTNFILSESDEKGKYKIIRTDGEEANETLSEGEKTFITFLYFYQLVNGSHEQENINTERIVVIDDPISSLDSNILFTVSHLISNLKKKVRKNTSKFKQLIILTHNVYFHKEITFNKGNGSQKLSDETFWVLRKTDNISYIKEYGENPIKNSYELLWAELKENQDSIVTPNIMRRIMENYFKFFGNINVGEIVEGFPEEEKVACHSLLSWANDGSHHMNDDLYVDSNHEVNHNFLDIFRRIFQNSNHESHFNMMMKGFAMKIEDRPVTKEATSGLQRAMGQVTSSRN